MSRKDSDVETRLRTELAGAARGPGVAPEAVRRRAARRRRRAAVREALATALVLAVLVAGEVWFNAWRGGLAGPSAVTGETTAPSVTHTPASPSTRSTRSGMPSGLDAQTAEVYSVVEQYVAALVAGDCARAGALFAPGKPEYLCAQHITAARLRTRPEEWPVNPGATEMSLSVRVTGELDPSFSGSGTAHLFANVRKQPDGRWLINGVGTGP